MSGFPVTAPKAETSVNHRRPSALEKLDVRDGPSRLPLPKVLLCDLDGTLIDSMPTLADLATEVLEARYGTPRVLARELYLATCGLPFERQLEEIFPGDARNGAASAAFEAAKPARCGAIRMSAETRRAL